MKSFVKTTKVKILKEIVVNAIKISNRIVAILVRRKNRTGSLWPKMRDQDRGRGNLSGGRGKVEDQTKAGGGNLHTGRGATAWGREEGGDDAAEAGGGNLHRGRGATARGREEGGDDATEAGGGNLHRGRGATAWGREEGGDDATEAGGGNLYRGRGATEDEQSRPRDPPPGAYSILASIGHLG